MEVFKEIKGFEGRYSISNYGRVLSTPKDGKPTRFLKQDVNKKPHTSYCRVTMTKPDVRKRVFVHRLVLEAFVKNAENKPFVNHIDNNGLNNNLDNLEWCTHSENMQHAEKQGRLDRSNRFKKGHKPSREKIEKESKPVAQYTTDSVFIRSFDSISDAERHYGIKRGKSKISLVCRGLRKTTLKTNWRFI